MFNPIVYTWFRDGRFTSDGSKIIPFPFDFTFAGSVAKQSIGFKYWFLNMSLKQDMAGLPYIYMF